MSSGRLEYFRRQSPWQNNTQNHIGISAAPEDTEELYIGSSKIVADPETVREYTEEIEPYIEEGAEGLSYEPGEVNSVYWDKKNDEIHEHPGDFDVSGSVDYNFGVALGRAFAEKHPETTDIARKVEAIQRYRPARQSTRSTQMMKAGAESWEEVMGELDGGSKRGKRLMPV